MGIVARALIIALGGTLAACAGSVVRKEMNGAVGQPVSVVVAKLGFPTEDRVIAGQKVYIWSTSNFVEGSNYHCKIRAILDEHDMIASWDMDGNEAGCARYASKLASIFN
jgi:hypothetical protein